MSSSIPPDKGPASTGYVTVSSEIDEHDDGRVIAVVNVQQQRHKDAWAVGLAVLSDSSIYAVELSDFSDFAL